MKIIFPLFIYLLCPATLIAQSLERIDGSHFVLSEGVVVIYVNDRLCDLCLAELFEAICKTKNYHNDLWVIVDSQTTYKFQRDGLVGELSRNIALPAECFIFTTVTDKDYLKIDNYNLDKSPGLILVRRDGMRYYPNHKLFVNGQMRKSIFHRVMRSIGRYDEANSVGCSCR